MKGVLLVLVFILVVSLISALPNPASSYCSEMGYTEDYENSLCLFPDGTSCDEWAFYRGECGQQYIHNISCAKAGEQVGVTKECCEGLIALDTVNFGSEKESSGSLEYYQCEYIVGGYATCSDCGNGVCESWENWCNCKEDCETCIPEDGQYEIMGPDFPTCCSGLKMISCDSIDKNGLCLYGCIFPSICTKCGDGICGGKENKCNCPEDCGGEICGNGICGEKEANLEQWLTCNSNDITYCSYNLCEEDCAEEPSNVKIVEYKEAISNLKNEKDIGNVEESNLKAEKGKPIYFISSLKTGRLFFIIPVKVKINSKINAQNGEVESIQKPLWSFLVKF